MQVSGYDGLKHYFNIRRAYEYILSMENNPYYPDTKSIFLPLKWYPGYNGGFRK